MITRFLHIFLVLNILASSVGIVVSKHYCGGELKSTAFFHEAESCHQPARSMTCPMHGNMAEKPNNCCENDTDRYADEGNYLTTISVELPDFPCPPVPLHSAIAVFVSQAYCKIPFALPPKIPPLGSGVDLCRRLDRWLC